VPREQVRRTILGDFIIMLLNYLPYLKDFLSHQAQYLQLIAQFAKLGPEARRFLLKFHTMEQLLNMIFGNTSPYYKEWLCKNKIPVEETKVPDMGLPT
jgi:hypothetical protein